MKFFLSYGKQKLAGIGLFLLFTGIFVLIFTLYHIPLMAVIYPAILCFIAGAGFLAWDFVRARRRHKQLSALLRMDAELMQNTLPSPQGFDDADYQAVIDRLCRQHTLLKREAELRYADMVEYYTVWAHQIKTPIAAMRLTLQNEDSPLSHTLSAELLRIEQYADMVLVYLRLDSGTGDYVIREQALDPIVRASVKRFSGEFILRRLSLDYKPLSLRVLTDEKWLGFVIEQVLSNALKYTRTGGISIFTEGDTLCIRDTGMGISAEDLPKIFDKGFTGLNGRSDRTATGIGLYLCRRVCGRLGHTIEIYSRVGEGTTVKIGLGREKIVLE